MTKDSRDGKFYITAAICENHAIVRLEAKEYVTIYDIANTIFQDCFKYDKYSLNINNPKINFEVITRKAGNYEFQVTNRCYLEILLSDITKKILI